jgi:diketogulonate reductase-like aldo/keto reductase
MAEDSGRRAEEIAALRLGVDLGLSLIDTAEASDDGAADQLELVSEAFSGRRDEVFLSVGAKPELISSRAMVAACERSLRRLRTDRIDLYVLQGRSRPPLREALVALGALILAGKIRYWGVADFDVDGMIELAEMRQGRGVAANQVLYSLLQRGVEHELLPWSSSRSIPLMAHSPLAAGDLLRHSALRAVADRHGATAAQVALAWVVRQDGVCATIRARSPAHIRENRRALDLRLGPADLSELEEAFPTSPHILATPRR